MCNGTGSLWEHPYLKEDICLNIANLHRDVLGRGRVVYAFVHRSEFSVSFVLTVLITKKATAFISNAQSAAENHDRLIDYGQIME